MRGDLLKETKVEFDRGNGPVADSLTFQTAEPDIFVGGDVYTGCASELDRGAGKGRNRKALRLWGNHRGPE